MRKKLIYSLIGILDRCVRRAHRHARRRRQAVARPRPAGWHLRHPAAGRRLRHGSLDLAVERIRERVDSLGVAEPEILRQGDAIVVNLPGVKNQQQARSSSRSPARCTCGRVLTDEQFDIPCVTSDPSQPAGGNDRHHDRPAPRQPRTPVSRRCRRPPRRPWSAATPRQPQPRVGHRVRRAPPTPPPRLRRPQPPPPASTTVATGRDRRPRRPPVARPRRRLPATRRARCPEVAPDESGYIKARGGSFCLVGPAGGTGEVFQDDATAESSPVRGGASPSACAAAPNGRRRMEHAGLRVLQRHQTLCPTRQLAIELDGEVISAPTVQQPNFTGSVQITGSFSESEKRATSPGC